MKEIRLGGAKNEMGRSDDWRLENGNSEWVEGNSSCGRWIAD